MRVLIFTHHYLDDNSGGSFASRAYINAFSEIADTCMLMYPDRGIPITDFIHKKCILHGVRNDRSKLSKLLDYYRGRIHRYMDVMMPQINEFKPDIVVFDNSRTTGGMLKSIKAKGIKTITIHHNYEMEYYRGTKPSILWRIPFMHYMEEAEGTAVLFSDLNLTLTEADKSLLQKHYDPHLTSKIMKLGSFESNRDSSSSESKVTRSGSKSINDLCFVISGTLGSYQTEVSVLPFLKNEYPLLLEKFPNSKLIITGRRPSLKMIKACALFPSINLLANPDNMQEIIAQADVYICPTCVGGGLKLRVMDGLKAGLPVISHAVSARGYEDFSAEKCMFIYDSKDSFKECLDEIGRQIKEGNPDPEKIKKIYNHVFQFDSGVNRLKDILIQTKMI